MKLYSEMKTQIETVGWCKLIAFQVVKIFSDPEKIQRMKEDFDKTIGRAV